MKVVFVYLTSGKPDMIAIKAVNAIRQADILLGEPEYLAELTEFTASDGIKASGIGELCAILPLFSKNVNIRIVRILPGELVGTDRLIGELRFFSQAGFETEVVPGLSSIQIEAAEKRLPLTLRDRTQGFFVIDCRQMPAGRLFEQVRHAAASSATLVLCHAGDHEQALLALIARERGGDLLLSRGEVMIAGSYSGIYSESSFNR